MKPNWLWYSEAGCGVGAGGWAGGRGKGVNLVNEHRGIRHNVVPEVHHAGEGGGGYLVNEHEGVRHIVVPQVHHAAAYPASQLPLTALQDAGHSLPHTWRLKSHKYRTTEIYIEVQLYALLPELLHPYRPDIGGILYVISCVCGILISCSHFWSQTEVQQSLGCMAKWNDTWLMLNLGHCISEPH